MAAAIQTGFQRLQFTPDLLPADLIGTLIYNPRTGEFTTKLGPIFSNLILADEINRAPAKVQSALLEAMQERQVTIGEQTYPLPDPFLVLATQNPIRTGRHVPTARGATGSFHVQVKRQLSAKARGAKHPRFNGDLGAGLCVWTPSLNRSKSSPRATWSTTSTSMIG